MVSPDDFLGDGTAGDALKQYLKYNRHALAAREQSAPVIVLRDWEASDVKSYEALLDCHESSVALLTPERLCNPMLGESFAGIERYIDLSVLDAVVRREDLGRASGAEDAPYVIARSKLHEIKPRLIEVASSKRHVGPYLAGLARWLDDSIAEIMGRLPASLFY